MSNGKEMIETTAFGTISKLCELTLGRWMTRKPKADTVNMPEPPFSEIRDLCSKKTLRFTRPPRLS